MTDLCSINADFSYVPSSCGASSGCCAATKVRTIGKPLWTGLSPRSRTCRTRCATVTSNDDGDVVAEVDIEGTQHWPGA